MYPSTRNYLKQRLTRLVEETNNTIVQLIEETNDTEHDGGRVTISDIQKIVDEIKRPPGTLEYHDVDEYYKK